MSLAIVSHRCAAPSKVQLTLTPPASLAVQSQCTVRALLNRQLPVRCQATSHEAEQPIIDVSVEPEASSSGLSKPEIVPMDRELVASKMMHAAKRMSASKRKQGTEMILAETLDGMSFTLMGDDYELSCAVAKSLGNRLGWFPVDTIKVVCGLGKVQSLDELTTEQTGALEAQMMAGMRKQLRVVVPALPQGAVMQEDTWRDLYGSIIIWIDEEDKLHPKASTPARHLYESKAELALKLKPPGKGFAQPKSASSVSERAKAGVDVLLMRLAHLLAEEIELVTKKKKYVQLGCRGDWPELQPAEWSPVTQQLAADRQAKMAASSS